MKVFIISFGPNPRVVAKFQTDRFRTFGENRGEKKIKNKETFLAFKPYTQRRCYATLRGRGRRQLCDPKCILMASETNMLTNFHEQNLNFSEDITKLCVFPRIMFYMHLHDDLMM